MRRRHPDARGGGRHRCDAPAVEEEAADIHGLPRDAQGARPGHRHRGHAGPLACAADDRGRQGGDGRLGPEARQRGHRGGPGDGRRGAQVQARGAGRHAAAEHSAPDQRARQGDQGRQARHDRPGGGLLLLPDAGDAEPSGHGAAGESRLRDVDRSGPDAPLQLPRAPAQLARLHGVQQRHRRGHVRPHARHGPVDDGSRHAATHQFSRGHPGGQGQQGEHLGFADRDVRLRQPAGGLDAQVGTATRPIRSTPGVRPSTATRARSRRA